MPSTVAQDLPPLVHGLLPPELTTLCEELGQPAYRARQLWHWLYQQHAASWDQMHNLPKPLRVALGEQVALWGSELVEHLDAGDGTVKILLKLRDGACIESVLIPARERRTVCVSSQVGCRYQCAFCASGQAGLERSLLAGEIVEQVLWAAEHWQQQRPSNVVFMGIGEPFDNYDALLQAIRILNHPDGLGIGARRMTISTCGVVPGIERLRHEGLQVELSVSLHGATDEVRSQIMPVNRQYPLGELLSACAEYSRATGRIVTFEYTLVQDVNDSEAMAHELARRLRGQPCRVNLIPLSRVPEYDGHPSPLDRARYFVNTLQEANINTTLRASKGGGVDAACGQLRLRHLHSQEHDG